MSSKISIIVPVYKAEKYLYRCLSSIARQTYKNIECIIVDDGSPDNCPSMCDEFAKTDRRFKVIHQTNQGVCAARNAGIRACTGEYVGFVDSDDWIESNMYETLYNDIIASNADVAVCGLWGDKHKRGKFYNSDEAQRLIYDEGGFGGYSVNKLIRRCVLNVEYNTKLGFMEDGEFLFRLFKNCDIIYWHNVPLYHYELNPNSVSFNYTYSEKQKTCIKYYETIVNDISNYKTQKSIRNMLWRFKFNIILGYIRNFDTSSETYKSLRREWKRDFNKYFFTSPMGCKTRVFSLFVLNEKALSYLYKTRNRIINGA